MNLYPKKRWGQNFLVDPNILRKIVRTIDPKPGDIIIEIGAGKGALTQFLVESRATIHAFEIDSDLIPALKDKFSNKINFILHQENVLTFNYSLLFKLNKKVRVVGNIPYNITSPLLFKVFENSIHIKDVIFLVQKEIAQRICEKPDNKDYGILSVLSHYYGSPKMEFHVSPNVFRPIPKVVSSVISIRIKTLKDSIDFQKLFLKVIKTAFNKRRKTLNNSLCELIRKDKINCPIDLNRRAETLTVDEFINLTKWLFQTD